MTLEEAILKAICEKTGIDRHVICSKTRMREVVLARQIGYYLYRNVFRAVMPLKMCGPSLYGMFQDHSTIIHNIKACEGFIETEPSTKKLVFEIKERVDELMCDFSPTMPINQTLELVMQAIPYNNCASF